MRVLKVGVESYVDLIEADNYVKDMYMDDSEQYTKWFNASENKREVVLRTSCRDIDNLRFDGSKQSYSQNLQFPRKGSYNVGYGYSLYVSQFIDNGLMDGASKSNGLKEVRQAQIENAVHHLLIGDAMINEEIGINIKGITAKKAGSINENYNRGKDNRDAINGIYTSKVYEILKPYLNSSCYSG